MIAFLLVSLGLPHAALAGPDALAASIFFAEEGSGRIGRISPAGVVRESAIIANPAPDATAGPGPCGIVAGPDGKIWFGLEEGDAVGNITTDLRTIQVHLTPTSHSGPIEMTRGPDGNVWFAEGEAGKIASVTPGFQFTEYTPPTSGSRPYGVKFAKDGTLWFTKTPAPRLRPSGASARLIQLLQPTAAAAARLAPTLGAWWPGTCRSAGCSFSCCAHCRAYRRVNLAAVS